MGVIQFDKNDTEEVGMCVIDRFHADIIVSSSDSMGRFHKR